jgi:hypothetical protein
MLGLHLTRCRMKGTPVTDARGRRPERGLRELYQDNPERADAVVWGRHGGNPFLTD